MRINVICFALGIWWLQRQPELPALAGHWLALPSVWVAFAAWRPADRRAGAARAIGLAILAAACGFGWAAWCAQQRLAGALPAEWEGRDIAVVGVVASLPQVYERSLRFEFDVERVLTPDAQVPQRVTLAWWGSPARADRPGTFPELHAGERWQLAVRLRRPHGTANPNGFDYEAWLFERGVRATGYVRPGREQRRLDGWVAAPAYWIERARGQIRTRLRNALPDAPFAGVLAALAIGDQRAIPAGQWQTFTRTGINHLMSISGLHVTMISGLIFAVVLAVWRRLPQLTLRLPARKAAAAAGLLAALAYTALAGFAVPAQRTVYMLAVVAAALWSGRLASASVVLAAALFAVLAIDPWAVLAPGFWLSFGAVAAILYVTVGRIRQAGWLASWLRVQWAITLGLVPLLLALFQQVSLVSPLANAWAIPMVSLVVVPLTLVGVALPFDGIVHLAHGVMAACMVPLEWMSAVPAAVWQQHAPAPWTVAVALAGVIWLLLPRGFPARWLGAIALLPLLLIAPTQPPAGGIRLAVLDVGQGTAVVAQTRTHALLYDTGPAFGPEADSGNRIVVPFLRAAGIPRLDVLMISHDDKDHSGGAVSVMQAVPVGAVFSSLSPGHSVLTGAPNPARCEAGQRWEWDGVRFEVLHPSAAHYLRAKQKDNDVSCVLRIETAGARVLIAGDIERKAERELLAVAADKLPAEALLVPHHGSRTSSAEEFVAAVGARYAIFTAGYRNRFGHPREDVVERYRARGSRIYRSDRDGALLVDVAQDGGIKVSPWRSVYRRYWQAPRPSFGELDDGEPPNP